MAAAGPARGRPEAGEAGTESRRRRDRRHRPDRRRPTRAARPRCHADHERLRPGRRFLRAPSARSAPQPRAALARPYGPALALRYLDPAPARGTSPRLSAELAGKLEVVFAGSVTEEERALLGAPDLVELVRFVGWVERPRALALQRAADTLLVVTEGAGRRSVATGKLYEYLAASRPILVLGDETEAGRIVTETGSGLARPGLRLQGDRRCPPAHRLRPARAGGARCGSRVRLPGARPPPGRSCSTVSRPVAGGDRPIGYGDCDGA